MAEVGFEFGLLAFVAGFGDPLIQVCAHCFKFFRMPRIASKIVQFPGIVIQVVEFFLRARGWALS